MADVPAKLFIFLFFKPLEFLYEINLKFGGNPHTKFKGDVLMSDGSAIASGARLNAYSVGFFTPFFYADTITIQT